jgi:ankyrin repeat protein
MAVQGDNLEEAQWRFERYGSGVVETRDERGFMAALRHAVTLDELPVVQYLVEAYTTANIYTVNTHCHTPLHLACVDGTLEVVQYLVEKVSTDIYATNSYGDSPLHIASRKGYIEIVKYLAENGADINAVEKDGFTSLHFACVWGSLKAVQFLVDMCRADIYAMSASGDANKRGMVQVVQYLGETCGADSLAVNEIDRIPLHTACDNGSSGLVLYLVGLVPAV